MLRVLMIVPTFNYAGGIETVVMNNIHCFDSNSIRVDVVSHTCSADSYIKEVEDKGGSVFVFPPFSLKNIKVIKENYERLLELNNYDVVHCHMANAAFLYLMIAKNYGVKVRILHSHQDKYSDKKINAIRNSFLIYLGKKWANCNIACSKNAGDFLFGKGNYFLLKNAIEFEKYRFDFSIYKEYRSKFKVESDEIIIGHTGRLTAQKNQGFLIDILKKLVERRKYKYKLFLVGSGDDLAVLKQKSKDYGLEDHIFFLGERNDISELLCMFDLFVFPSIYEGLGISLLEAQASGLNCIASDNIPYEATISDNVIYLSLKNIEEWLREIERLSENRVKNRESVILSDEYSIKHNAEVLLEYYKNCIKQQYSNYLI